MNAKEFLLTDPKLEEAVSNGYDIRLEEHEWIEKMELYALTKQNSHKPVVMQAEGSGSAKGATVASEGQGEANTCAGTACNCILYKILNRKICGKYTGQDCCG